MKIFSRQKTYKNTEFKDACASFSFIYSVSKICLNVVNIIYIANKLCLLTRLFLYYYRQ